MAKNDSLQLNMYSWVRQCDLQCEKTNSFSLSVCFKYTKFEELSEQKDDVPYEDGYTDFSSSEHGY